MLVLALKPILTPTPDYRGDGAPYSSLRCDHKNRCDGSIVSLTAFLTCFAKCLAPFLILSYVLKALI